MQHIEVAAQGSELVLGIDRRVAAPERGAREGVATVLVGIEDPRAGGEVAVVTHGDGGGQAHEVPGVRVALPQEGHLRRTGFEEAHGASAGLRYVFVDHPQFVAVAVGVEVEVARYEQVLVVIGHHGQQRFCCEVFGDAVGDGREHLDDGCPCIIGRCLVRSSIDVRGPYFQLEGARRVGCPCRGMCELVGAGGSERDAFNGFSHVRTTVDAIVEREALNGGGTQVGEHSTHGDRYTFFGKERGGELGHAQVDRLRGQRGEHVLQVRALSAEGGRGHAVHEHREGRMPIAIAIYGMDGVVGPFHQTPWTFADGDVVAISPRDAQIGVAVGTVQGGIAPDEDRVRTTRRCAFRKLPIGLVAVGIGDHVDGHFHFTSGTLCECTGHAKYDEEQRVKCSVHEGSVKGRA